MSMALNLVDVGHGLKDVAGTHAVIETSAARDTKEKWVKVGKQCTGWGEKAGNWAAFLKQRQAITAMFDTMNLKRFLPLAFLTVVTTVVSAADTKPSSLPRSTPEKQGVSSAALLDFIQSADTKLDAIHSFMLVRHGNVIAEGWWTPYNPQSRHQMFSLSKSFTSTAVGLAISEGKLSLFDPVVKFFPDDVPTNASDNLKAMRVRDLLTMSSGQQIGRA